MTMNKPLAPELDLKALAARAEIGWRDAKEDCAWFIDNFCYIEDKDVPGIKVKFKLWEKAIDCPYDNQDTILKKMLSVRRLIMLKARQLGYTWLCIAYSVWRTVFNPGYTVSVVSRTENEAKEFIRRVDFMLRNLPDWIIRPKKDVHPAWNGATFESGVLEIKIHHSGGEEMARIKGHAAGPDAVRSFTDSLLIFDEWAYHDNAEQIFQAAYAAINRVTGGQFIGLSTGKRGTLFEEQWNRTQSGKYIFTPAFSPWYSDPRRTDAWYRETKSVLKHRMSAEYPSNPEEAFAPGEGAFFDVWDPTIHFSLPRTWYPPYGWRIIRSYDGGYRRACCKWYAVSPDGWIVCYREYYPENKIDPEQAEDIRALSRDPNGGPEEISYTIADTSCWNAGHERGESTAQIFLNHGIPMRQATKDRVNGWKRLLHYLNPYDDIVGLNDDGTPKVKTIARLRFTKACVNTGRTYPSIEVNPNNPEDIALRQEDHCQDTDRYLVMSMPRPNIPEEERQERERRRRQRSKPASSVTGY